MWTDFHSHVLPGIDDGAKDVKEASVMLHTMENQQVKTVFATPHYYAHCEKIEDFVEKRQVACTQLEEAKGDSMKVALRMAAEVALEPEICRLDLTPLFYEDLSAVLLELPASHYKSWMSQEIEEVAYTFSVIPILAHFERYLWYEREGLRELLRLPKVVVQISANMLANRETMDLIKDLYSLGIPVLLGSDAHNCGTRPVCFDIAQKILKKRKYGELEAWITESTQMILSS